MRILMVTSQLPTPAQPGSMAPVARQIESVRALGAEVEVLEIRGVKRLKYLQSLAVLRSLATSVDLIHAHYGYCGWVARSQLSKPVVVSFMGDDLLGTPDVTGRARPFSRWVVQADCWLARTVDAVIVKSAEMARIIAPVKVHIIPNGVDLRVFRPIDARAARGLIGLADNKRYILFPGRPEEPRKGFALAQAAVKETAERTNEPLELISLWGVAPYKVPLYMNACDAMVLTSFWEGSPNVVKEAMACNLPVVSVPVGDVPELLADVDGCSVCPREVEALAVALVKVLGRIQRTNGRVALERKGLDLLSVARKLMNVYVDVLTRSRYVRHSWHH
jgi:glycosyltransferase involved in cell wall biosynthesis